MPSLLNFRLSANCTDSLKREFRTEIRAVLSVKQYIRQRSATSRRKKTTCRRKGLYMPMKILYNYVVERR